MPALKLFTLRIHIPFLSILPDPTRAHRQSFSPIPSPTLCQGLIFWAFAVNNIGRDAMAHAYMATLDEGTAALLIAILDKRLRGTLFSRSQHSCDSTPPLFLRLPCSGMKFSVVSITSTERRRIVQACCSRSLALM